jgi:hypothetical protein
MIGRLPWGSIMRRMLLGTLVGLAFVGAAHADDWVVEARFPDQVALQRASRHFTHVIVDRQRNVLRVDTNDAGIDALRAEGLEVTIDTVASAKLDAFYTKAKDASRRGLGLDGIPGYECFRTLDETFQTLDDLEATHPDIAKVDLIGPTWQRTQNPDEGYDMRAMHITNFATLDSDPDRPRMAALFSIHAREYTPLEIGTRFAEWLVNNYGADPEATWLVDHNDFHLVLPANPDARPDAEQQIYQRKNLNIVDGPCEFQDSFAQPGIDLNRNFPFHWNITLGWGSSDETCDQTFHGPYADGSDHNDHIQGTPEPETANMVQYIAGTCAADGNCAGGLFADHRSGTVNPDCDGPSLCDDGDAAPDDTPGIFIAMHSNAALVLWPWGDTEADSPNVSELTTLGRRIGWFAGYRPQQSNELYFTDGTTVDSMYGLLGVASYTIETNGIDFFEDCETFENNTAPTNIASLRYIARTLHAPYRLPAGPDTVSVSVSSDLVVSGDPVQVTAQIDSSRYNQSNGTEPVHDIFNADMYIGVLPWDTDAVMVMAPVDGAFDSPIEAAEATVTTAGWAPGRYLVYVQAGDTASNSGTPNAAFINIADASQVGTLTGSVTDQATTAPLVATIALHNPDNDESHTAVSDAGTGEYAVHAFPGTFDIHVSAPHYLAQTLQSVEFAAGDSLIRDFELLPDCPLFTDDIESGATAWTSQSPWTIASGAGTNTTHVWNTPNYGDNLSRSLTTAASYDLTGYSDVSVDFDDRCDLEGGADFGFLEFSTNGGAQWTQAYSCTGQSSWQSHHIELPAAANNAAALKIRFRLQSDSFQNAPGWAVDNVRIAAGGQECTGGPTDVIFADGFEP